MEDGRIADDKITASSTYSPSHSTSNARLNRPAQMQGSLNTIGAWTAKTNDQNQWIEVYLITPTWVTGVIMQGREDYISQRVTEYKVEYSSDRQNWIYVNGDQGDMVSFHNLKRC